MSKYCTSHWFSSNTVIVGRGFLELFILVSKIQGGRIHSKGSCLIPTIMPDTRQTWGYH